MPKIVVYSCVTGKYDNVSKTLLRNLPIVDCDASFVLFTDQAGVATNTAWQLKDLQWQHVLCKRRTARWHKTHSHVLFPTADVTVWIDGSQMFKPVALFETLIAPNLIHDIATFKHPIRNCVYQELQACERLKKDNPLLMRKQIEAYSALAYPSANGMVETACVIRRNSPVTAQFNEAWWAEIDKYSFRDQLSFNYVAYHHNIPYSIIPGCREQSPYFHFHCHG